MSRTVPLNQDAVEMFTGSVGPGSKVLILGGTGWFGRTALAMLRQANVKTHVVASNPRQFHVDRHPVTAEGWDYARVAEFEPDVVLDFAYLTVDKGASLSLEAYVKTNGELAERLFFAATLPSTRSVLSVSSGASVRLPLSMWGSPVAAAYSRGKQAVEARLAQIASNRGISVGVARAWSVTGGHIQNPQGYAFSGMILEGLERGLVSVRADSLVYRRYSAVEELLALAFPRAENAGFAVLDSGGRLVEVRELARLISAALPGSQFAVNNNFRESRDIDSYFANEDGWKRQLAASGLQPLSLECQIDNVVRSLKIS